MTEPSTTPEPLTSVARVNRVLGRPPEDDTDALLPEVVEAVNSLVPTWREVPPPGGEWAPHQHFGASLLAARLRRRADSPGGVAQFGIEGPSYVQSNWPDVAMLLGVGGYAVGRVG